MRVDQNHADLAVTGQVQHRFDSGEVDGLVHVTLSNPTKLNAMSRHMWQQLRTVFESIQANTSVYCVLISGAPCGKISSFSAGGDISEYPSFRFAEQSLRDFHENDVWGALQAMLNCDVPIVAQIEGACMGAGLEMASCCDIRVAGTSAKFGAPIAKLGFPMAPKEAAVVMRAVGELTAREMLLEAAVLDAAEMKLRGFLNRVVADDAVQSSAMQSVRRVLGLAPNAARLNKQTIRKRNMAVAGVKYAGEAINSIAKMASHSLIPDDQEQGRYHYAASFEHQEGINAFIEKRKPHWR